MYNEIKIPEKFEFNANNIKKKKYLYIKKNLFYSFFLISTFIILYIILKIIIFYEKKKTTKFISELIQNEKNNFFKEYINYTIFQKYLDEKEKLIKIIENNIYYLYKIHHFDYSSKNLKTQNKSLIINTLHSMEVKGKNKIRIGRNADGGYILLNDFDNVKIAYSFGIANEISFEKDLADKNIDVFMYDHTITNLPYENPRFHWKKIGLASDNSEDKNMKTLNEIIIENNHSSENNMILKIDIESSEWNIFKYLTTNTLTQFKFIVGEFHFNDINKYEYLYIIKKIQITHQIFHLHCNNCALELINFDGYYICSLLEISFIKKEGNFFIDSIYKYPINGLDYNNCNNNPEMDYLLNIFL